MKSVIFTLILSVASVATLRAEDASPATSTPTAKSEADRAHDAVWAIYQETPANPNLMKENPREYYRWMGEKFQRFYDAAVAFVEKYPNDPRRWEAIVQASFTRPLYIIDFKEGFDARPTWSGLIEDEGRIAAFQAAQKKRFVELEASSDATPRQRGGA